ncbi:hypothetical protein DUI87_03124 [Hirundo rustica rustica]|uniref:Uncharacterized protein n=1 Tax=Hirundo rustica rustica TaxID=333673 RepID=A0A3M0L3A2_HIRRU|nr:hypothetical protein DUI87_03124 [Hirundo rustica rustica]
MALTSKDYQRAAVPDSTLEKEAPWSLVNYGNRIFLHSPSLHVPTSKRYKALAVGKTNVKIQKEKLQQQDMLKAAKESSKCQELVRGIEAPICQPDIQSREACCLPGAKIQDVTEKLAQLTKSADYYPLLLSHMGTNDMIKHCLNKITQDLIALGLQVKGTGVQDGVIPSVDKGRTTDGTYLDFRKAFDMVLYNIVGNQGTEISQNLVPIGPDTEMNAGFDLRPWKRLPDLGTRSKNVDL